MPSTRSSELASQLAADSWLGAILGCPAYRATDPAALADLLTGGDAAATDAWHAMLSQTMFAYAKVPTETPAVTQALEQAGFRVVDTNVIFDKPIIRGAPPAGPTTNDIEIRMAGPDDQEATATLARGAFRFSRFHLDPAIPAGVADRIKAEWAANFFHGGRGDAMVLAFTDKQPAGFLQLLTPSAGELVIDLVAVAEACRRRGVAGRMITFAEDAYPQAERIIVGTQIANLASVRFYEGLGFRLCKSAYVLHCHGA